MPKKLVSLMRSIRRGLNESDPRKLETGELSVAQNVVADDNVLRPLGTYVSSTISSTGGSESLGTDSKGYGIFHLTHDRSLAGSETASEYVFLGNATDAKIDIFDFSSWNTDQVTLAAAGVAALKPVFYSVDGDTRIADAGLDSNVTPRWWGYIKKDFFQDLAVGYQVNFDTWADCDVLDSNLDGKIDTADPTATMTSGHNVSLRYSLGAAGSGTWSGYYSFYCSLVFDDGQQLLPSLILDSGGSDTPILIDSQSLHINPWVGYKDASASWQFNKRVSGFIIYYSRRKNASGNSVTEPMYALLEANFASGVKIYGSNTWISWIGITTIGKAVVNVSSIYFDDPPSINSFESINGFSESELSIDIGQQGDGWAGVEITNRVAYAWGTKRTTSDNVQVWDGDTIYKSIPNRFDTFPAESGKLTIVKGDGEDVIRLIGFADRLFVFKQNSLRVLNVSGDYEFLEAQYSHVGILHPEQVVRTEYGLFWTSKNGIYFHDGKNLKNMFERNGVKVINQTTWESFYTSTVILGYVPASHRIILFDSNPPDYDAYIVNVLTGAIYTGHLNNAIGSGRIYTNFINDKDGNLHIGRYEAASTNIQFYKWSDSDFSSDNRIFAFNAEDFNAPGLKKKIYALIFIYKNNSGASSLTTGFSYYKDGEESSPTAITASDITITVTSTWTRARFELTTPIECETFRLYFSSPASEKIEIKDILAEVRVLPNKVE